MGHGREIDRQQTGWPVPTTERGERFKVGPPMLFFGPINAQIEIPGNHRSIGALTRGAAHHEKEKTSTHATKNSFLMGGAGKVVGGWRGSSRKSGGGPVLGT